MVHTIAQITGTGVAVALASSRTPAKWIQFTVPSGNASDVLVGDSNVSATRGTIVSKTPQLPVEFPPIGDTQYLDLASVYAYIANNDKLNVTYGL